MKRILGVHMRNIALIGIGMGYAGGLTLEAQAFIQKADLLIGAERMLNSETAAMAAQAAIRVKAYLPADVRTVITKHPEADRIAVLLSGDTGFYSGAEKLLGVLPQGVRVMPGISCVSYFCSRVHRSWQEIHLVSLHGNQENIVGEVLYHPHTFAILGSREGVSDVCSSLEKFGLGEAGITIGCDFGMPTEQILTGCPKEFIGKAFSALSVILIDRPVLSPDPEVWRTGSVPDTAFIRGKVPMTKEEVRTASLAHLQLTPDAVVYDIGAGTGSVTVCAALRAYRGQVFAIEQKPEAVELIRQNALKFHAANVHVIAGTAPEALQGLPAPTHVFVGGSGGMLGEIVHQVVTANPSVRIVINAVTLETLSAALNALKENGLTDPDVVCLSAARSIKAGRYHLMHGEDPVYILTAEA